jgi:hypothetical protein
MLSQPAFREACEKDGIRVDWALLKWIAGVESGSDLGGDGGSKPKGKGKPWWKDVQSKL